MKGNPMAVAGFVLSIIGWALIWIFPYALICWLLGAAFSYSGERSAVRYRLPHLWLARTGIAISVLPVIVFAGIVLYANLA